MITLNILVEGQTEETFTNNVLKPHLATFGVNAYVRRVMTKQDKRREDIKHRGGGKFKHFQKDLTLWLGPSGFDDTRWFTTMIDLYAFPDNEASPYSQSIREMTDPYHKVAALEKAMASSLVIKRFIPYVQLHEFEALVLCDTERLIHQFPECRSGVNRLCKEIQGLEPERINDGRSTAPSKRIINHIPAYKSQKATAGPDIVRDIGLPLLRERCPHFNEWVSQLEQLGTLG